MTNAPAPGVLYVIATSLGDPADLSPRAVAILRGLDVLYAEDTRAAARLLAAHQIALTPRSCFDANEAARAREAADRLRAGKAIGVVSEAGTPGLSDPGFRLVRAAIDAGARVVPIPGPSAAVAALSASGLPTDRFHFAGFPPRQANARRKLFTTLGALDATLVFYESPHRVAATLADLADVLGGDRPACVARELSKPHEEFVRGPLAELAARYRDARPLGEITLLVGRAPEAAVSPSAPDDLAARAAALMADGRSTRDAVDALVAETGLPRRVIYAAVLKSAP